MHYGEETTNCILYNIYLSMLQPCYPMLHYGAVCTVIKVGMGSVESYQRAEVVRPARFGYTIWTVAGS